MSDDLPGRLRRKADACVSPRLADLLRDAAGAIEVARYFVAQADADRDAADAERRQLRAALWRAVNGLGPEMPPHRITLLREELIAALKTAKDQTHTEVRS